MAVCQVADARETPCRTWEAPLTHQYTAEPTGTPRASPTRAVRASTAGPFQTPNWWRPVRRWAMRSDRLIRPGPRPATSATRTISPRATRTRDNPDAAGTLNETENSVKISVVNV